MSIHKAKQRRDLRNEQQALADLENAFVEYHGYRSKRQTKVAETWESMGLPPLVAYSQRYIFMRAKHALLYGVRLDQGEYEELITEYQKRIGTEVIPPEVVAYLAKHIKPGRGRPSSWLMVKKKRDCRYAVFLLWGYYKKRRIPMAREYAMQQAALIFSTSFDSVVAWTKGHISRW